MGSHLSSEMNAIKDLAEWTKNTQYKPNEEEVKMIQEVQREQMMNASISAGVAAAIPQVAFPILRRRTKGNYGFGWSLLFSGLFGISGFMLGVNFTVGAQVERILATQNSPIADIVYLSLRKNNPEHPVLQKYPKTDFTAVTQISNNKKGATGKQV